MPYKDPEKQREYQRKRLARRRVFYLKGKVCEVCGSKDNLHFHHRDPSVKESHRIWSWRVERLESELEKCDVLCSICHGKAHRTAKHGSKKMYSRGCRCGVCRGGNRLRMAEYRKRKRLVVEQ